ncbi:MAG: hypothetical protein RIS64_4226 [Bacteroidota bacterium]|jgi:hypothetical protein
MNGFKEIAVKCVEGADDLTFASAADSIASKKIICIRTRTGGKTSGKLPIVSVEVLKTMILELKDFNNNTMGEIPLATVLQMSDSREGRGLVVEDKIAFANSKISCLDPSVLVTGQGIALLIEFEK